MRGSNRGGTDYRSTRPPNPNDDGYSRDNQVQNVDEEMEMGGGKTAYGGNTQAHEAGMGIMNTPAPHDMMAYNGESDDDERRYHDNGEHYNYDGG